MDAASLIQTKPLDHIEPFQPGDTVTVNLRIVEGDRQRVQAFQGNVIVGSHLADDSHLPGDTFTVRRVSYGVGVERIVKIRRWQSASARSAAARCSSVSSSLDANSSMVGCSV